MTIAISAKVQAGVVLGTDSATTYPGGAGAPPAKVYYNTNKLFQMHERLPIAAMTWGLGTIGTYSISALMMDMRIRFEDRASAYFLDPATYTMDQVATSARKFVYELVYRSIYPDPTRAPGDFGLLFAGFSTGADLAEEWIIEIDDQGACPVPDQLHARDEYGIEAFGVPDAFDMLVKLRPPYIEEAAAYAKITDVQVAEMLKVMNAIAAQRNPIRPSMPLRDVIELVWHLAGTEANYRRFLPDEASPTVGGPIEVAAVTRHEGVRWIQQNNDFRPLRSP